MLFEFDPSPEYVPAAIPYTPTQHAQNQLLNVCATVHFAAFAPPDPSHIVIG
jgi:hypothetical protein